MGESQQHMATSVVARPREGLPLKTGLVRAKLTFFLYFIIKKNWRDLLWVEL